MIFSGEYGVRGRGREYALVLHSPRFWEAAVLARGWPCWAVVRRLVGIVAATWADIARSAIDDPRMPAPALRSMPVH
jgi:hypothetical protein